MNLNAAGNLPNSINNIIPKSFFSRSAVEVARDILGKLLVRKFDGCILAGLIVEAEAYQGENDLGCHAKAGLTQRTKVMYGPPGHAYVYFTYGLHWMLNAVTGDEGFPAAVLIRGIEPVVGLDAMRTLRAQPKVRKSGIIRSGWTDGPAKLCKALGVDGKLNDIDLCNDKSQLWIADAGINVPEAEIRRTPRIGMNTVPEPWFSIPWRFVWDLARST